MPHLPPVTIFGGSVKVRIPISEVNENGEECGEPIFQKRPKPAIEAFPPDGNKLYSLERYSVADHGAQIYRIEIHGNDEDEVFEFRPKDGKCKIEIYYALSNELPLTHVNKWMEPGEEGHPKGPYEHE